MLQNLQKLINSHADKVRFIIVGGANTVIDYSILFALVNFASIPIFYSNMISTGIALCFSFLLNKKFTFKDKNATGKSQIIKFLVITLVGLWIIRPIIIMIVDVAASLLGSRSVANNNLTLLIGLITATCVTLIWNFYLYKKFVFKTISD